MSITRIDAINYVNVMCLALSLVVAAVLPFELFVFAYAVLGPLHYLTEISWLSDRRFFGSSSNDWRYLVLPVVPITAAYYYRFQYSHEVITIALSVTIALACGMVLTNSAKARWVAGLIGVAAGCLLLCFGRYALLLTALLPTLIHVYLFTGLFMLQGALSTPRISGFVALALFILGPYLCLYVSTTPAGYEVSDYILDSAMPFLGLLPLLKDLFGLADDRDSVIAFMRLLAFAYTYHYLNWFSKAEVIKWHRIPRRRGWFIVGAYLVAVATYFYDFRVGFGVLLGLSVGHVVLELPLNFRSIVALFPGGSSPQDQPKTT